LQYLDILLAMSQPNRRNRQIVKCDEIIAKNKEERITRATAQLKVEKLSSELISQPEIPCVQDEEVAEAALPPSEVHWGDTLDSDLEEEWPECNHDLMST
jgi:hypothetical protein